MNNYELMCVVLTAKGDDLVETVVSTVPKCALQRGVYSEDALRRRFLRVEQVAWRVAGIPSDGGSLPKLLASWLQSLLIIKAEEPIPTSELNNQPIDPALLNNYDILQRARLVFDDHKNNYKTYWLLFKSNFCLLKR